LEKGIDEVIAKKLKERVVPVFEGEYETKVWPDELTWRKGLSRDDVTREICNVWKSDLTFASVVCSRTLGKLAADLMGWGGAKLAQDDIFWKPTASKSISFHRDLPYFDFIVPSEVVTIWIALTPATLDTGTLEYARGSHLWKDEAKMEKHFHAPEDYLAPLKEAATKTGNKIEIVPVVLPPGGISVHHGNLWHGSGTNKAIDGSQRMSLAIHYIPENTQFSEAKKAGYTYGRYKIFGSTKMEETFFPIVYRKDGYVSPILKSYFDGFTL